MHSILMVSKPVVPPWNDSGKNLVRDVVANTPGFAFHVLTTRGATPLGDAVRHEPIYGDPGAYAPGLAQNLRVLRRLLARDGIPLYHFFFAPNPRTSQMARLVLSLKRRRTVHTIGSVPQTFDGVARLMFADRVVALSTSTKAQLEAAGVTGVVHIPPAVPDVPPQTGEVRRAVRARLGLGDDPVVLYAGDYEFSSAARAVAEAAIRVTRERPVRFVFACRVKRAPSRDAEAAIRAQVVAAGVGERVVFLNEVDDMAGLLAAADLHVQPAGSLYAKMDIPLVLLESLREGVPLVVAAKAPLDELIAAGAGVGVPPEDGAALAAAVTALLDDGARRRALAEAGQRALRDIWSPRRMGAAYAALYEELLAPAKAKEEP